ncbi:MAG TPA: GNAT family N-acetyltransferase [Rhizomicrobium sp.]|nr:GNAT family N-acetyltransferase [Rhizomicrobium sp.]
MKLIRATAGDLPEIVALMNRAYRGQEGWAVEHGYIQGDRISLPDLEAELAAKPQMQLLVWREEGLLLGCVSLEPQADDAWYLGALTVVPDRQDARLGRGLLAEAERIARDGGAKRMRLTVIWVREALIAWYRRRGYAPTGKTTPFPYDDERWGRPMRDDLHFVWFEKVLDA